MIYVSMVLHVGCLILTVVAHKMKNRLKDRGFYASMPTKKLKAVCLLSLIQLSVHLATFMISAGFDI